MQSAAQRKDQYVSDSDSEYGRPRQRRRRSPPVTRIKNAPAELYYAHKDYDGRLPLCYYATGIHEGCPHDGYACFNMRDILVRFHVERKRNRDFKL